VKKVYTTDEAARTVKISRASLQEWIRTGKIAAPAVQLVGGKAMRLWRPSDLAKLRAMKAAIYGEGKGPNSKGGRARKRGDRLLAAKLNQALRLRSTEVPGQSRHKSNASDARADRIVWAMVRKAMKGEVWAARAVADAVEGTVTGEPPPIDQDVLFNQGVGVREFLRRVKEKYDVNED
jgi:excisionase family DNA binding protein